ncbi:MAG: hypothetical protein J6Q73_09210 [Bacteroidaceae bacterium]|nr:hypothetical protein [Bacteroidaceae bacterium]
MSTTLRGILIILFTFTFVAVIAYQSLSHRSARKRAYTYLMLASALFPFLDLGMSVAGIPIKVFSVASTTFLIFNFNTLYKLAKRYYLIIIYAIILIITSLTSEFKSDSLSSITDKLRPAIVFLATIMVFEGLDENNRLKLFAKYMKVPIIMALFFGFMQVLVSINFSVFYSVWAKDIRISSCFPDPQIAGCCIAILAAYTWHRYLNFKKPLYLFIVILLAYIGLQTGSKAFLLGFVLSILTSFIFTRQKSKYTIIIAIISIILILTQDYWSQLHIFERLSNAEESLEGRQEFYWLGAIEIFKYNWATGIGSGIFQQYIEKHNIPMIHQLSDGVEVYASQPESGYLLWLDELGIFSVIYIVIILYLVFKKYGNQYINISMIIPWFIAFVSLYNLQSNMLIYILFMTLALMFQQSENQKKLQTKTIRRW